MLSIQHKQAVSIFILLILSILLVIPLTGGFRLESRNRDDGADDIVRSGIRVNRSPISEPTVMVLGENVQNPREGDTVVLHCLVDMPEQTEAVFVRWTFGRVILTDNENLINADVFRFTVMTTREQPGASTIFTLVITNLQSDDFGEYRCVVGYDAFHTGHPGMQMWAKIDIEHFAVTDQITPYPTPQCIAGGAVDGSNNVWLKGNNIYVECLVDSEDPNMDLSWTWVSVPGPVRTLRGILPFRENGTTSIYFQITAHNEHNSDIFICESTSSLFPGVRQNCTIGPLSVINELPTSKPESNTDMARAEVNNKFEGTSGNVTRSSNTVLITFPPTRLKRYKLTPVIIVSVILGIMILLLLLMTIFIIWLRKKHPHNLLLERNAKRIAEPSTSGCSLELYSSPGTCSFKTSPTSNTGPKYEITNPENHNYDIISDIHVQQPYKSVKSKPGVAIPYAITEIQDPQILQDGLTTHSYATVWRESPDGASDSSQRLDDCDSIVYDKLNPVLYDDPPETPTDDDDGAIERSQNISKDDDDVDEDGLVRNIIYESASFGGSVSNLE